MSRAALALPALASMFSMGVCMSACTGDPGLGRSTSAIVGGTTDTGDPAIVLWVAQVPGSQLATICTTTLVSPHVVLTAAHCADPDIVGTNAKFSIYTGVDVDLAKSSDFIPLVETHFNPDFSPSDVMKGADIAVGILGDPLDATPVAMNRSAITDDLIGQAVRMVGYGKSSGTDTNGATAGTKRQVTSVLDSYTDKILHVGVPGATTCEGDSGGPALMMLDGVESIVGVVSFGDIACEQLGADTRVDVYADSFVAPFIAAADPNDPAGKTASHGCEVAKGPSTLPLPFVFWVALALWCTRRARRVGQ